MRIESSAPMSPLTPHHRGRPITIWIDGEPVTAFEGETLAGVLLAEGRRALQRHGSSRARGLYCGIGVCFECLVMVESDAEEEAVSVRACVTLARDGMRIHTRAMQENRS